MDSDDDIDKLLNNLDIQEDVNIQEGDIQEDETELDESALLSEILGESESAIETATEDNGKEDKLTIDGRKYVEVY